MALFLFSMLWKLAGTAVLAAEEVEEVRAFAFAFMKCSMSSSFESVDRRRFSSASGSTSLVLSIFSRMAGLGVS